MHGEERQLRHTVRASSKIAPRPVTPITNCDLQIISLFKASPKPVFVWSNSDSVHVNTH